MLSRKSFLFRKMGKFVIIFISHVFTQWTFILLLKISWIMFQKIVTCYWLHNGGDKREVVVCSTTDENWQSNTCTLANWLCWCLYDKSSDIVVVISTYGFARWVVFCQLKLSFWKYSVLLTKHHQHSIDRLLICFYFNCIIYSFFISREFHFIYDGMFVPPMLLLCLAVVVECFFFVVFYYYFMILFWGYVWHVICILYIYIYIFPKKKETKGGFCCVVEERTSKKYICIISTP